jgi:hypothetical protein
MHEWISLSSEQRNRIRAIFNIPRSSQVQVYDGKIETDGTTVDDFSHLTIEKMQDYLGSESTDFHSLFCLVVERVQDEIEGKPLVKPEVIEPKPAKNVKKGK